MYLMIDNYDSFVYNLRAYFEEAGHEILVIFLLTRPLRDVTAADCTTLVGYGISTHTPLTGRDFILLS